MGKSEYGIDIILRAIDETGGILEGLQAIEAQATATQTRIEEMSASSAGAMSAQLEEMGASTAAAAENLQGFAAQQAIAMENFENFSALQDAAANMSRFGDAAGSAAASVGALNEATAARHGFFSSSNPWVALMLGGMAASGMVGIERTGMRIEEARHYVGTLIDGNQALLDQWEQAISAMGPEVGQTPANLWSGLYEVLSMNVAPGHAMEVLKAAAMAATAGKTDVFDTAKLIGGISNAYGGAISPLAVSDKLMTMVHHGGVQFHDLAEGIGPAVAWAAQLGISLNQVGAGLDVITEKGINPAEAMTGLRDLFAQLVRHEKNFREAGIDIVSDAEHGGLPKVLADLEKLTKGNKIAIEQFIPDIRALTPLFDMLGKGGPEEFAKHLKEMRDSEGETLRQTDGMLKGASGAWKQFLPEFDNLASAFLKVFDPTAILHFLTFASEKMTSFLDFWRESWTLAGKEMYDILHFDFHGALTDFRDASDWRQGMKHILEEIYFHGNIPHSASSEAPPAHVTVNIHGNRVMTETNGMQHRATVNLPRGYH